ncbi:MAG: EpsD family peptidyl-prolyl cis-trans isomerase [Pseudomonadota bacterium]
MKSLIVLCVAVACLAGCDESKEAHEGQALVSVNGEEITAMQLNEELQRANVQQGQQDTASRQLLQALIDRQLLQNEAIREKLDRDPKVVQAIERAKALIVAQAYMQKRIGNIERPNATEVGEYYRSHPEFFANRKQFDMQQLVIETRDLTDQAKQAADKAKTLDDMAAWFDAGKVKYMRTQASRTTSDLSPDLSAKLKTIAPGQLFVVREGPRSLLVTIAEVKDNPASLALAAPQIEKYLIARRSKDAAEAELARLRSVARIEYLNKTMTPVAVVTAAPAPADAATARGVAGLK